MQCPACKASVQTTQVCPRCQADLSILFRIQRQSRVKLARSLGCALKNQVGESKSHMQTANTLHQDKLNQLVQRVIMCQFKHRLLGDFRFSLEKLVLHPVYQGISAMIKKIQREGLRP